MNNSINQGFDVYEKRKQRKRFIIIVLFIVVFLGVGYAYLQTTLNISGTTTVAHNTWNVYWDSQSRAVTAGSVSTTLPVLSNDDATATFTITGSGLAKPGDFYEFTIDAVNAGTINAMISNINKTVSINNELQAEIPSYISFEVTYSDDVPIVNNQILEAAQNNSPHHEKYKVRVEYKKNINPGDLAQIDADTNMTFTFSVDYIQADANVIPIKEIYYTLGSATIGGAKPGSGTFDDESDAQSAAGTSLNDIYLKQITVDEKNALSIIKFKKSTSYYELKGGSKFYNTNKAILTPLFTGNSASCTETMVSNSFSYSCVDGNFTVEINDSGFVGVYYGTTGNEHGCVFKPADETSLCGTKSTITA